MEKFIGIFKSRKFWSAVIGLVIATGVLQISEGEEATLLNAILVVVTAIGYGLGVAIEDAGHAVGEGTVIAAMTTASTVPPPSVSVNVPALQMTGSAVPLVAVTVPEAVQSTVAVKVNGEIKPELDTAISSSRMAHDLSER